MNLAGPVDPHLEEAPVALSCAILVALEATWRLHNWADASVIPSLHNHRVHN